MTKEEAIEKLRLFDFIGSNEDEEFLTALDTAIESLENQKVGYWIENAPEWQNIDPPYICSECGNFHLRKTNYCDQCGAKMIEPQKSEKIDCKTTKCENCINHNYCDFESQESRNKQ